MITKSLKRHARKRLVTPIFIAGLLKSEHPLLRNTGAALKAHRDNRLTADESRLIEAIERVRFDLSISTEIISIPDYGAGSPSEDCSVECTETVKIITEVVGDACRNYSKPRVWATLLFHLIRHSQPRLCVELGACLGISAAYQASALELNGQGRLVTFEGAPPFAVVAVQTLRSLGLHRRAEVVVGRFDDTLDSILGGAEKIDYVFVDGHHDEQATVRYFNRFLPHLAKQAIMVFDDISWSPGMRRAWQHISSDARVDVSLDFSSIGVCLMGVGTKSRHAIVVA
jgi:predicted O-methyltransferase YrrM